MLRIVGGTQTRTCGLLMDDYVPIRLRCSDAPDVPIYWRAGNFRDSLIEIGLHPDNGTICKITVTTVDPRTVTLANATTTVARRIPGMPICDIQDWPENRFKDELSAFRVEIGLDSISILLNDEGAVDALYETDVVSFGVNEAGYLCYLVFKGISKHDIDRFDQITRGASSTSDIDGKVPVGPT